MVGEDSSLVGVGTVTEIETGGLERNCVGEGGRGLCVGMCCVTVNGWWTHEIPVFCVWGPFESCSCDLRVVWKVVVTVYVTQCSVGAKWQLTFVRLLSSSQLCTVLNGEDGDSSVSHSMLD